MRFFPCLFPSFSFIIIFFYHSYHKNNCLSHKGESFFNNRGQNIITAYDRDIHRGYYWWREDMNFSSGKIIFYERVQRVKYCFCHKKIKFILSSSRRVMFFLLYRQKVIVTAQMYSTAYKTLFTIIWRNNTELNRALHWQSISKATEIQRTQDVYKFWREITEITSSINSRVRLWKINHSGPGCSFYEFYEWYIFL